MKFVAVNAAPFIAMLVGGAVLCVIGLVWFFRTKHLRAMWRRADHDITKVAVMLELEERVRELEATPPQTRAG